MTDLFFLHNERSYRKKDNRSTLNCFHPFIKVDQVLTIVLYPHNLTGKGLMMFVSPTFFSLLFARVTNCIEKTISEYPAPAFTNSVYKFTISFVMEGLFMLKYVQNSLEILRL